MIETQEVVSGELGSLAAEFVDQSKQLAEAESEVTAIKQRMASLETLLLEEMGGAGVSSMRVADRTIYLRTDLFVNKPTEVPSGRLIGALRAAGLKSQVREWRDEGAEIPAELAGLLKVSEAARVICRR